MKITSGYNSLVRKFSFLYTTVCLRPILQLYNGSFTVYLLNKIYLIDLGEKMD